MPHRQFVFTVPKRLRLFFRFDRGLLGELPRLAWQTVLEVYRAVLDRGDVVPGMVATIHTFGQLLHFHPHVHALVTDGAGAPDGTFIPLPQIETEPFEKLWQKKVFDLLLERGKIDESLVRQMSGWRHSGFAVNFAVRLGPDDVAGRQRLAHSMLRCPFSLERLIRVTPQGKVLYLAEKNTPRHFPGPASPDLFGGTARNFQLFDPLDFIAELTQHIPDTRKHLGRAFGFYSNRARGMRAKANGEHRGPVEIDDVHTPGTTHARRRWASLIKQVWRIDPLVCPRCGTGMKILSFITTRQRDVIQKILRHCGLWPAASRAPPSDDRAAPPQPDHGELRYVSDLEFVDEPAPLSRSGSPTERRIAAAIPRRELGRGQCIAVSSPPRSRNALLRWPADASLPSWASFGAAGHLQVPDAPKYPPTRLRLHRSAHPATTSATRLQNQPAHQ